MTNSATSTKTQRAQPAQTGFQAWHFFTLLSMLAATAVVMVSRDTHPVALLLLSAAVVGAGFVGVALSRAVAGFFSKGHEAPPLAEQTRAGLEREKMLILRSIKELEFDKAMGKVGEQDYVAIVTRLRARAMTLMQDLDRPSGGTEGTAGTGITEATEGTEIAARTLTCPSCRTVNDADARFCKACGSRMGK